jgi:cysteine desulfurase
MPDPIYLDHNATTPVLPEVLDAMLPYLRERLGNPSSTHVYGRRARAAVEQARDLVAELLGCDAEEVFFTSGGTEANNLAIRGFATRSSRRQVVVSALEHPSVAHPVGWLAAHGWEVLLVDVDESGRARIADIEATVTSATALVTLAHSNGETGVLQPLAQAVRLARRVDAYVHSDAAQSVGKVPVDVRALDVDLLTVVGHKLYAPQGVGALYVRKGLDLEPLMFGAGHERGLRPGTENVPAIVGLGAACAVARRDLRIVAARVHGLRERLWSRLAQGVSGTELNGHVEERLPNTLNVRFPLVSGAALLAATPEVAASTGSACHEGKEQASSVLLAMGIPASEALGSVRLTLGRATTAGDVDRAAEALIRSWGVLVRGATHVS